MLSHNRVYESIKVNMYGDEWTSYKALKLYKEETRYDIYIGQIKKHVCFNLLFYPQSAFQQNNKMTISKIYHNISVSGQRVCYESAFHSGDFYVQSRHNID